MGQHARRGRRAKRACWREPVARWPGRPQHRVRTPDRTPERSYPQSATTVRVKLYSNNLIARCTEPDGAALAFTDSGRQRFSTKISTQKCSKAEPKCYMPWSYLQTGAFG